MLYSPISMFKLSMSKTILIITVVLNFLNIKAFISEHKSYTFEKFSLCFFFLNLTFRGIKVRLSRWLILSTTLVLMEFHGITEYSRAFSFAFMSFNF